MSQDNVELVQRAFEHFLATGEPPWDMIDEELQLFDHDTPDQGDYFGHAGFGRWLDDWSSAWAEWSFEPERFVDAGDCVVVFIRMNTKGRGSGVEVERQDAEVCTVRDGKIVRIDYYNNRRQALEMAGVREQA